MFPADGERLLASAASGAAIGQRHVVQLGPHGAHGAGALTSAGRGARAGMQGRRRSRPVTRAWLGVLAGRCMARSSVWVICIISCGRSKTILRRGVILPEMECCGFRPSQPGRAGGWGQSEHPIRVTTQSFGVAPYPASRSLYRFERSHSLPLPCLASRSSCSSTPYVITWTVPPLLRPHNADFTHPPGPAYHSVHSL